MGQTLSEPVVEKTSTDGKDDRVCYGVSAMQGWRISMEDAHSCVLDLKPHDKEKDTEITDSQTRISFFGVYDGHGGEKVAQYAGENLHKIVAKQDSFKENRFEQALKDGFLATDRAILADPKYEEEVSGCTASVAVITHDKIYVGNAGDSRSILGIKGRSKPLSFDHKPQNPAEKARICAAGGFVDFGRVNGNLALSRAIGDFEFKKSADLPPEAQIVTAFPEVSIHEITDDDEFMVIACDGIWDCQSSQAVIEFVRRGIVAKQELSTISENMMDNCLASNSETGGVGCDNMTMTIVGLLKGKTKQEWYEHVAERVAKGDGPCAPPEYASRRGPGVHHHVDDSDEYDMEMDSGARNNAGQKRGNVYLMGMGDNQTQILTDQDNPEMFDENSDLENQVSKGQASASDASRSEREGTPGPEERADANTPSSTQTEHSDDQGEAKMKAATDTPLSPQQKQQLEQQ